MKRLWPPQFFSSYFQELLKDFIGDAKMLNNQLIFLCHKNNVVTEISYNETVFWRNCIFLNKTDYS